MQPRYVVLAAAVAAAVAVVQVSFPAEIKTNPGQLGQLSSLYTAQATPVCQSGSGSLSRITAKVIYIYILILLLANFIGHLNM